MLVSLKVFVRKGKGEGIVGGLLEREVLRLALVRWLCYSNINTSTDSEKIGYIKQEQRNITR